MDMGTIRTYESGDEAAQVKIYNEAAADLPKFKAATLEEARRRCEAPDFDSTTRFFALDQGHPVGYATFHPNGRVSFPWCFKGSEDLAEPLFDRVLEAMKQRGLTRAFAAYRGDWPRQRDFFLGHGFRQVREMVNFVLDLAAMPTPAAQIYNMFTPLRPSDLSTVRTLVPGLLQVSDDVSLEKHLFHNPYFPPDALFALRHRPADAPFAVGILVVNPAYANPLQVDSAMPCFRLGAFGTEGMQTKRIQGLFSFLAPESRDVHPVALDLLGYAAMRYQEGDVDCLAAQVPSDATHLHRFYKQYFRQQGSFPIFERAL
jgi:hypothetical protein